MPWVTDEEVGVAVERPRLVKAAAVVPIVGGSLAAVLLYLLLRKKGAEPVSAGGARHRHG